MAFSLYLHVYFKCKTNVFSMIKKYSVLFIVFLCIVVSGFAQTTIAVQDFDGATPTWNYAINPATYNVSNDYWTIRSFNSAPAGTNGNFWAIRDLNNGNGGGNFEHTLTLADVDVSAYNTVAVTFRYYKKAFDGPDYLRYEIAYNGGAFGAPVELTSNANAWNVVTINAPIGTTSISLRMIGFQDGNDDYAGWDDFKITGTPNTPVPTISADISTITGLDYIFPGGPSTAQSYQLSAVDLVPAAGNITVTAPTNFSISKTQFGTYTPTLTYAYTGGALASSAVWVQLNGGLPINVYGPLNITHDGGGATTQNVSVTGNVSAGGSGASDIVSVPGSETAIISSLTSNPSFPGPLTSGVGVQVWQFRVRDGGGTNDADLLPTILTDLTLTQFTGNAVGSWDDAIQSIDLFWGATHVASGTATATQIQFTGMSGANVTIPDNTERTFSIRLSLLCPMGLDAFDTEDFVFGITNANVTFSVAGSGKSSFSTQKSTNGQNVINVTATDLVFTVQPINTGLNNTMVDVVVTAVDPCGNVNTTFTGAVNLTSSGTMSGSPTVNAVDGVATFTNIIVHTVIGSNLTLTASSGFGINPVISAPFDITPITILDPGDLAILAINTNTGSGDQIAFVIFKTITAGTRIYFTDNGYERKYAGLWGNTEGVMSITRTGPDLSAGTIIVIETAGNVTNGTQFDVYTCGVIDTNWTKDGLNTGGASGFNLNGNDDIWIMQGGIWNNVSDHSSTYTGGNVLYGWTESGWDLAPGGGSQSTRWSTIYPGLECFNTVAPTGPGKVKFNDPVNPDFSTGTNARLDWISLINTTAYWDSYSDNTAYNAGGYDYKGNVTCPTLTISATTYVDGKWTGNSDENWFNCSNWDTLEVPDETVDVTVAASATTYATIDADAVFASYYSRIAKTQNLTITGQKVLIDGSSIAINVLEVHGDLLIDDPSGELDMTNANADDIIYLYGDWRNDKGTSGFLEGNGTVYFTGSNDQIITNGLIPTPPITTEEFYNVVLNNDFDTSISNNLFMRGNLSILGGSTLRVTDGNYAYVHNDLSVSGNFIIDNNGSLVQGDDTGTNTGAIRMDRNTSIRRQDYVYWSSPVNNFTVNDISPLTPSSLIYKWNPTFANTNGTFGNWVSANGETMLPGVGYILRGPDGISATVPSIQTTTFNGASTVPFNGVITPSVSRQSIAGVDDQWNLIGNPYPSAIDAFAFLNQSPNDVRLDGFVNLWTHGTLPNTGTSSPFYDDFGSNYTASDYITYNGMGASAGIGEVSIGAGQSFMVNLLDTAPASTTALFNNSMRDIAYDNSQFYRISSDKSMQKRIGFNGERHRIWLDLISETHGTNRILVGYASEATMERDRLFDAIADVADSQWFYSMIADETFNIQGRALPFEDTDIIPLGVQLVEDGNYHIAIGAIDGLFETENQTIYLKDNALGFTHNLTENPYSFSAETGVINDRFEIVFVTPQSLSVYEQEQLSNGLTIVELQDGRIKFTASNGLDIKNVKIYDTLGRLLYDVEGNSSTEIYNFSNLSRAAYIAQVTLSNDSVINKKAVKRN